MFRHTGGGGMSQKSLTKIAILIVQSSILLTGAHARDKELGKISIRVIDQVGVPEKEWRLAQETADKIFQSAGLSVNWVHCTWNASAKNGDCPSPTTPDELSLVMVSDQTTNRMQAPARVFGMSLMATEGSFGSRGYIYYGRIQSKCTEQHDINEALLLGTIVAHELGHLLLGPNSHSQKGIMKSDFERDDMTGIQLSGLQFNGRQRETLRSAVERRLDAANSKGTDADSFMARTMGASGAR
jgi:hypothetical protein